MASDIKTVLSIFLLLPILFGVTLMITRYVRLGNYPSASKYRKPYSTTEISGDGAFLLGLVLTIFGAAVQVFVWLIL